MFANKWKPLKGLKLMYPAREFSFPMNSESGLYLTLWFRLKISPRLVILILGFKILLIPLIAEV
ncbi:hypothetical protein MLGJGCBP_01557 [Rhodococcus sp. T7]|nr:hypothetical protein MLGJGCBP_01557 [Rhodococcus sp. T7]